MDGGNERNVSVDPDLLENPDYIAYKASEADLLANHVDEWVAFADGKLVLAEKDWQTFWQQINKDYPDKSVFIRKIEVAPKVVHIGRPAC